MAQLAGTCPPLVVPQYIVTVGFSPPVAVTFPFKVAVVEVTLVAAEMVMVGGLIAAGVVKLKEAAGQLVPALLVALALK